MRQKVFQSGDMGLYRTPRNKVNRMNKQMRGNYYKTEIESLRKCNNKKWWKTIKQLTGKSSSSGHELDSLANSLTEGDNLKLANRINCFFQSVSSDLPKPNKDILPVRDPSIPIPAEYIIPLVEVEKQLSKLDTAKAPGPDNVPTWVLKDFAGFLAGPVCSIFNASI